MRPWPWSAHRHEVAPGRSPVRGVSTSCVVIRLMQPCSLWRLFSRAIERRLFERASPLLFGNSLCVYDLFIWFTGFFMDVWALRPSLRNAHIVLACALSRPLWFLDRGVRGTCTAWSNLAGSSQAHFCVLTVGLQPFFPL
jgi:hypothetical protein